MCNAEVSLGCGPEFSCPPKAHPIDVAGLPVLGAGWASQDVGRRAERAWCGWARLSWACSLDKPRRAIRTPAEPLSFPFSLSPFPLSPPLSHSLSCLSACTTALTNKPDETSETTPTMTFPSVQALLRGFATACFGSSVFGPPQAPQLAPLDSCPLPEPSCHSSSGNTCCTLSPGGLILQTQFWDTSPATGPGDSWTIHGLW
jgi:hypothetical protein